MSTENNEITQGMYQYFCRELNADSLLVDYRRDDKLIEFTNLEDGNHTMTILLNRIDAIQLAKDILGELLISHKNIPAKFLKCIAVPYPTDEVLPIILIRDLAGEVSSMDTCVTDLIKRYISERKTSPLCVLVTLE